MDGVFDQGKVGVFERSEIEEGGRYENNRGQDEYQPGANPKQFFHEPAPRPMR